MKIPPFKIYHSWPVRRGLEAIADHNHIGRNGPSATAVVGRLAEEFSRVKPSKWKSALAAIEPFQKAGKFGLIVPKSGRKRHKQAQTGD